MNPNHCYDIHHTLAIDYINGNIQVGTCCQSGRIPTADTGIDTLWNTQQLIDIRNNNLNNQLPNKFCQPCIQAEKLGNQSRRLDTQEFYQNWDTSKKIRSLDINLGNLCNLKCAICGPRSSTAWIPDAKKMGIPILSHVFYDKKYSQQFQIDINDVSTIKDLEMIKFWGGEPLINDQHVKILNLLDHYDILKNCRVVYNTNGTHTVSDDVLKIWSRAILVEIYFSIDDVGERFDYQRYGAKWDQVTENLKWHYNNLPSNHYLYIMTTVSYLNIWYLTDLIDWQKKHFSQTRETDTIKLIFQPAIGPTSCEFVSSDIFNKLKAKFQHYPELEYIINMITPLDDYVPTKFLNYINRLDSIRNTSWKTTFKEFSTMLNND
jgi:organic radical activating enzyme